MHSVTQSRLAALLIGALSALVMPMVHAAGEGDHGHAGDVKKMQMSKFDSPEGGHVPLASPIRLVTPEMDAVKGKLLFINKGCIACHEVNGVGGTDAPRIDAHAMAPEMNIFEFGARMWNHSQVMTAVQIAAMGQQIKLTGEELGHITAFVHDDQTQHTVKNADIPHHIREKMHHEHDTGKDTH